jgi:hypothetical protein
VTWPVTVRFSCAAAGKHQSSSRKLHKNNGKRQGCLLVMLLYITGMILVEK